jgi:hypothetical protein
MLLEPFKDEEEIKCDFVIYHIEFIDVFGFIGFHIFKAKSLANMLSRGLRRGHWTTLD